MLSEKLLDCLSGVEVNLMTTNRHRLDTLTKSTMAGLLPVEPSLCGLVLRPVRSQAIHFCKRKRQSASLCSASPHLQHEPVRSGPLQHSLEVSKTITSNADHADWQEAIDKNDDAIVTGKLLGLKRETYSNQKVILKYDGSVDKGSGCYEGGSCGGGGGGGGGGSVFAALFVALNGNGKNHGDVLLIDLLLSQQNNNFIISM
ncbi:Hypothetical protein CINCED_3A006967 [Cinara cedri]|uniref:Uncharacterized protein n=1 Tax=Cinara cedri TaxID=506608 RepID=A0A5E4N590_9HEMI|nr:Hypothetical protein CINCED_3A006967 [Cinara cedri]